MPPHPHVLLRVTKQLISEHDPETIEVTLTYLDLSWSYTIDWKLY